MNNQKRPGQKPTHAVYHVREGANGKNGFWTKVGAGWLHEDGKGLSLALDYIPVGEGRLTVRVNEPKAEAETQGEAA